LEKIDIFFEGIHHAMPLTVGGLRAVPRYPHTLPE